MSVVTEFTPVEVGVLRMIGHFEDVPHDSVPWRFRGYAVSQGTAFVSRADIYAALYALMLVGFVVGGTHLGVVKYQLTVAGVLAVLAVRS